MSQLTTARQSETESTVETGANWLSVAQASAALNLSEKTVRKRIKSGEIEAMRVALGKGGAAYRIPKRAVYGLGTSTGTEEERNVSEVETEPKNTRNGSRTEDLGREETETESALEPGRNAIAIETEEALNVSVPASVPSQWEQREADFRGEIQFLREQLGEANRNAAELRAALRETLKAMPKAITSGTPGTADSSAIEAPISPAKAPDEQIPAEAVKTLQIAGNRPQTAPREARPIWKLLLGIR